MSLRLALKYHSEQTNLTGAPNHKGVCHAFHRLSFLTDSLCRGQRRNGSTAADGAGF